MTKILILYWSAYGHVERMAKAVLSTPADRTLNGALPEVRDAIRRMASTSVEVFFTERFVQLARPGGMIAVIVPESILASDQLGPLRLWLMQQVQLLAVVSLPGEVRIYSSTIPAASRHATWMQDRQYRTSVARLTMGYFYPPIPARLP